MFGKREPEPERPSLLGEDFDIFPDLGDRPVKPPSEDEEPEEEVDDTPPEPTDFQKRIADIPEEKWKRLQLLCGIVLGVLAGLPLTFLANIEFIGSWGLVFSAVVAILLPTQFERRANRRVQRLRIAMVVTLLLMFGFYFLYGYVINPSYFAAAS